MCATGFANYFTANWTKMFIVNHKEKQRCSLQGDCQERQPYVQNYSGSIKPEENSNTDKSKLEIGSEILMTYTIRKK